MKHTVRENDGLVEARRETQSEATGDILDDNRRSDHLSRNPYGVAIELNPVHTRESAKHTRLRATRKDARPLTVKCGFDRQVRRRRVDARAMKSPGCEPI